MPQWIAFCDECGEFFVSEPQIADDYAKSLAEKAADEHLAKSPRDHVFVGYKIKPKLKKFIVSWGDAEGQVFHTTAIDKTDALICCAEHCFPQRVEHIKKMLDNYEWDGEGERFNGIFEVQEISEAE